MGQPLTPSRLTEIMGHTQQALDLLGGTDATPETNPLQAVVEDLQAQLLLRTQERDNAVNARQSLVDMLAGLRTNLEGVLAALPTP